MSKISLCSLLTLLLLFPIACSNQEAEYIGIVKDHASPDGNTTFGQVLESKFNNAKWNAQINGDQARVIFTGQVSENAKRCINAHTFSMVEEDHRYFEAPQYFRSHRERRDILFNDNRVEVGDAVEIEFIINTSTKEVRSANLKSFQFKFKPEYDDRRLDILLKAIFSKLCQ